MHVGLIYGYPDPDEPGRFLYVGQVQSLYLERRHNRHLKGVLPFDGHLRTLANPPRPVELYRIQCEDKKDWLSKLAWFEELAMFEYATYYPKFNRGWNFVRPGTGCYADMGRLGGLIGGQICAQWFREHPEEASARIKRASEAAAQWRRENPDEASANSRMIHALKDADGKSLHAKKTGQASSEWTKEHPEEATANSLKANRIIHALKDSNGKSVTAKKAGDVTAIWFKNHPEEAAARGRYVSSCAHAAKDADGKSIHARKTAQIVHALKDTDGKSLHAKNMNRAAHAVKDADGKSINAKKAAQAAAGWKKKHPEEASASSKETMHRYWHVRRGILKMRCPLCWQLAVAAYRDDADVVEFIRGFFQPGNFPKLNRAELVA